jgi:hypothetical protein
LAALTIISETENAQNTIKITAKEQQNSGEMA